MLRIRYLAALITVATLTLVTFGAMEVLLVRADVWSTKINIAGRQRMLSQRIAKAAERGDTEQISEALIVFTRSHRGLTEGDDGLGLPPTRSAASRGLFEDLEPHFAGLTGAAAELAAWQPNEPLPETALARVQRYEASFLPRMHAIVGQLEAEAKADNRALIAVHLFVVIVTLVVLVVEALCVFEPAARRLRRQWTRLRESEERFELAVRGSRDAIWDWDLQTGRVYYSPRWAAMFQDERLLTADSPEAWTRLVASTDLERLSAQLELLKSGAIDRLDLEIELRPSAGATLYALCRGASVRDASGAVTRIAGSLADVTEQRKNRERLRELAECDGLTGLINRSCFAERLELAVSRRRRDPAAGYAVLYFDFDGFKSVNDALGHNVGDQLLKRIAERLKANVPEGSVLSRLGGDEFAILLRDDHEHRVMTICDELISACTKPHHLGKHEVVSTASIGVVLGSDRYEDKDAVLRDADTAMYEAKSSGKSQARLFDCSLHERAAKRLSIESRLRNASVVNDFRLLLQPIVDLDTGRIDGFEALMRWPLPNNEIIGPEVFIPIAEEAGTIIELGEWALERSAELLRELQHASGRTDLRVHVNLSRRHTLHPSLYPTLQQLKQAFPGVARNLVLEVTETAVMDARANLVPRLQAIRDLGFTLAMDDFGTGHSSLSCLHQFPLDELKIDRGFVLNIETSREFAAVYQSIVSLADNLGLRVVAEGVETKGQLAQLQAMGCHLGQGYLFAKPLTPEEATALLREGDAPRAAA